ATVGIPEEVGNAICKIWLAHKEAFKDDRRENLSDRRLKKVLHLIRIAAASNGRSQADFSDIVLLKDCLWNHPENREKMWQLILQVLRRCSAPIAVTPKLAGSADAIQTYEVADDGETLIPASAAGKKSSSVTTLIRAPQKPVVKGYKGSGTEQDPLLIETMEDLGDLARPEVGMQGYHFRQTRDIDCSEVTTWPAIPFKGHYDGGGHCIVRKDNKWLFSTLEACRIENLRLSGCELADHAKNGSVITRCESDTTLLNSATECNVSHCLTSRSVANSITGSHISTCQSAGPTILESAKSSTVSDCACYLAMGWGSSRYYGGIVRYLQDNSVIEKCFVAGEAPGYFSGFAHEVENSAIRQCALGDISVKLENLWGQIARARSGTYSFDTVESIDRNIKSAEGRGYDAHPISEKLFTQRHFEHTLGWDFDTVWKWDSNNNHPVLRHVGIGSAGPNPPAAEDSASAQPIEELLTMQMRANIWI
ncbi:MAG: hypothetical protein PHF75_08425, partial [Gallionella sp.]|nr:hypothetical protein [Gallionella sp.]